MKINEMKKKLPKRGTGRTGGMAMTDRKNVIAALKQYHDSKFTPGVYEHSIFGLAALMLKHDGWWIHTTTEDDDWGGTYHKWSCSNCGYSTGDNPCGTNYCPNCGTWMDGERK